jgi:hypothetical protein
MSATEMQRHEVETAEDFDLDLQITVVPKGTPDKTVRMDGYSTYTTCQGSCECDTTSLCDPPTNACYATLECP